MHAAFTSYLPNKYGIFLLNQLFTITLPEQRGYIRLAK